jgi:dynein heavy chain
MKLYYSYWERRIFNAITKMIVRALAANKTIWHMQETDVPCLIKMRSSYNHPDVQFHPNEEEVNTSLKKFTSNILESTKFFGRWWDGYCKIFDEVT